MPYEPPFLKFACLAQSPFAFAQTSDLAAINTPNVSIAIGTRAFSPAAAKYADDLDVVQLALTHGRQITAGEIGLPLYNIGNPRLTQHNGIAGVVQQELGRHLPEASGKAEMLATLTAQFEDISTAIKGRQNPEGIVYSGDLAIFFLAKLPKGGGPLHRDNTVDLQGFITICGQGTIGAHERVRREINLPGANPQRELGDNPSNDIYGYPSMAFAEVLREVPRQRAAIWLGNMNPNPFIHCEPEISRDAESRLIAIARPYENSGYYRPNQP